MRFLIIFIILLPIILLALEEKQKSAALFTLTDSSSQLDEQTIKNASNMLFNAIETKALFSLDQIEIPSDQTPCDNKCKKELVKNKNIDLFISPNLSCMGTNCLLTLSLYSLTEDKSLKGTSSSFTYAQEDLAPFLNAIKESADQLERTFTQKDEKIEKNTKDVTLEPKNDNSLKREEKETETVKITKPVPENKKAPDKKPKFVPEKPLPEVPETKLLNLSFYLKAGIGISLSLHNDIDLKDFEGRVVSEIETYNTVNLRYVSEIEVLYRIENFQLGIGSQIQFLKNAARIEFIDSSIFYDAEYSLIPVYATFKYKVTINKEWLSIIPSLRAGVTLYDWKLLDKNPATKQISLRTSNSFYTGTSVQFAFKRNFMLEFNYSLLSGSFIDTFETDSNDQYTQEGTDFFHQLLIFIGYQLDM